MPAGNCQTLLLNRGERIKTSNSFLGSPNIIDNAADFRERSLFMGPEVLGHSGENWQAFALPQFLEPCRDSYKNHWTLTVNVKTPR